MIIAICVASFCLAAGSAFASRSQESVIEDPTRLLGGDTAAQDAALDEMKLLGAEIVKLPVVWRSIAPAFDTGGLDNPTNYPAGVWDALDRAVNGAHVRGMKVWLMLTAPAPVWAVSRETAAYPGSYRPDTNAFGDFSEAVARRYGSVEIFSIWNEPNLKRFLQPQYSGRVNASAAYYRKMYAAAHDGLVAAGRTNAKILFGELLPRRAKNRDNTRVPPLVWLRDFFCIDERGKKLTGSAARKRGCNGFKMIKTSGLAYHPYTMAGGPTIRETSKDNATIYYLKRVERVLDQASKQRRVTGRRLKIFSSEFGFQSDPPDINFTQIEKIPGFLNVSEYLSYKDSRVATYSQYLLIDDSDLSFFQSGLRFVDGSVKTGPYQAYQLPFNVFKQRGNTVTVWGCLRAADGKAQTVEVQVKNGSSYATVGSVNVSNRLGYFEQRITVPSANGKTFRLLWNGLTSRSTKPVRPVKAATD